MMTFVLSDYILFCYTLLSSLGSLFFYNERGKGSRYRWEGNGEDLRGEKENHIQDILYKKKSIFDKIKEERK